jgi:protein-S-isoprenylcysteine O-methyltransferase Ste14
VAAFYSIFLPFKIGTPWFVLGAVVYSMGLVMMISALLSFAKAEMDELVIWGIYKYSRHPMSFSLVLAMVGIGLASASWVYLLASSVIFVIANIIVTHEEKHHLQKHGDEYHRYLHRTPKWLGFPKRAR